MADALDCVFEVMGAGLNVAQASIDFVARDCGLLDEFFPHLRRQFATDLVERVVQRAIEFLSAEHLGRALEGIESTRIESDFDLHRN